MNYRELKSLARRADQARGEERKRLVEQLIREFIKELKDKEFKYIPREEHEIDWSKYDEAQLNEINDMLLMIRDTVDEAALRLGIKEAKFEGPALANLLL